MSEQKLILTDVDGVLLDWVSGFNNWMDARGWQRVPDYEYHYTIENWYHISHDHAMELVATYNASAAIGFLPSYKDSHKYVKKLNEEFGFRFVAITAFGRDKYAIRLRKMNLEKVFGKVFDDFVFVDILHSKQDVLNCYEPAIWLEDKPSAAEEGKVAGHRTYLFEHGHNGHMQTTDGITRVHTWKEVYESIISEEQERLQVLPAVEV